MIEALYPHHQRKRPQIQATLKQTNEILANQNSRFQFRPIRNLDFSFDQLETDFSFLTNQNPRFHF